MPHPFFDASSFPWHHADAVPAAQALLAAYPQFDSIDTLYRRCGPGLPPLSMYERPDKLWKDALEALTAARALRRLCELVLEDAAAAAAYGAIQRLVDAAQSAAAPLHAVVSATMTPSSPFYAVVSPMMETTTTGPYCFLSYARLDADDPSLEKFATDFQRELRARLGLDAQEEILFRESDNILLGDTPQSKIRQALHTSRTFIALLSPTYVRCSTCAMEWSAFAGRLTTNGGIAYPGLLLPLLWIPIPSTDIPPQIAALQFAQSSFGNVYPRHGLRYLVQKGGMPYRRILSALADRMRDLLNGPTLPPLRLLSP